MYQASVTLEDFDEPCSALHFASVSFARSQENAAQGWALATEQLLATEQAPRCFASCVLHLGSSIHLQTARPTSGSPDCIVEADWLQRRDDWTSLRPLCSGGFRPGATSPKAATTSDDSSVWNTDMPVVSTWLNALASAGEHDASDPSHASRPLSQHHRLAAAARQRVGRQQVLSAAGDAQRCMESAVDICIMTRSCHLPGDAAGPIAMDAAFGLLSDAE